MADHIFAIALIIAAFAVLSRTIWKSTRGTELRITFRRGAAITVVTVPNAPDQMFTSIAATVGVSPDQLRVQNMTTSAPTASGAPPPNATTHSSEAP